MTDRVENNNSMASNQFNKEKQSRELWLIVSFVALLGATGLTLYSCCFHNPKITFGCLAASGILMANSVHQSVKFMHAKQKLSQPQPKQTPSVQVEYEDDSNSH